MNQMILTDNAAEDFAERVATLLDSGAVAAMLSIGHRAGLFAALEGQPPATSRQIADRTGFSERYLREWLAVMVTGRIVDYDPARRTYQLPDAHAACLVPGGALGNLAVYGQHIAYFGKLEERMLDLLRSGGGTEYTDYPCFHQIMAEDSDQTVKAGLFEAILPLVDGIEARLAQGIDVLDAGCGRGHALLAMAERYPASRFTGYDLGADAIDHARTEAQTTGLTNVTFEARDLTGYAEPGRFDFITSFDAVHDQKDPEGLIRGLKASLKPGGVYLMQDIGGSAHLEKNLGFPLASLLYAVSFAHCTPVSIGQGGEGLGTMWGWEIAQAMLEEAGFTSVVRHVLPHDPMNVWFVCRV